MARWGPRREHTKLEGERIRMTVLALSRQHGYIAGALATVHICTFIFFPYEPSLKRFSMALSGSSSP